MSGIYDINGNLIYQEPSLAQDFSVGSDFIKRPIKLTALGSVKYKQSFCKYDNKYYCTDGSNIAEYNSSFELLRDVAISVGHGNAMQLGSNGIAYVSGWDDQKIYAVDLETLTIASTINLPTIGYTTCAVDDVKHLTYIWQRDTRPNTEAYYNFIVYDYANNQTLYTAITSVAFGAMQSVDMYMDLIIVLNGSVTASLPNGYRIYDKRGNVVSEYVIGSKSNEEPEGIFVDRSTRDLLISFADKIIYRVSDQ